MALISLAEGDRHGCMRWEGLPRDVVCEKGSTRDKTAVTLRREGYVLKMNTSDYMRKLFPVRRMGQTYGNSCPPISIRPDRKRTCCRRERERESMRADFYQ